MGLRTFRLPDLGEGLAEAEIVEWHVAAGDRVVADQPLVSVETDKAVVEVPSPWSGTVAALRAQPGEIVEIGAPIADIDSAAPADQGAIVGDLEARPPAPTSGAPAASPPSEGAAAAPLAVPAARARARDLGIALGAVRGTGPGGAITVADVVAHADRPARAPGAGARRAMARAMARAHADVVPATLTDVADVTPWLSGDADVMIRLVRAIVAAAAAEPALNGWYDPEGRHGGAPEGVAIGIAVDTPGGLFVPVLHRAETLAADAARARLDDLVAQVRDRRLDREAQQGATITLSNFGPIGGRHASLVVSPPQIAILGAGRAYDTVAWQDGGPVRRIALPLSLTFDHRAATGGETARFLAAAIRDLELPA